MPSLSILNGRSDEIKNIFSPQFFFWKWTENFETPNFSSVKTEKNYVQFFFVLIAGVDFWKIFTEIYDRITACQICRNFMKTENLYSKLMRLGLTNWIVNDSDSKPIYFDHRFWSDLDSNDLFESTIAISIYNRSIFDILSIKIHLFVIYYQLKLIFSIYYRLKDRFKLI